MKRTDSDFNIFFLIFTSSHFDFVQFILSSNYIPKFLRTSESLDLRLSGVLTISSALFFYYLLKLPILKHQYFSLLIIGTCLIIIVITEYIFQDINVFINYGEFTLKILLIIFKQLFLSLHDSNQKYVIECNYYVSYFLELAIEGFIGLFITLIYLFTDNTFKIQLALIYSESSGGKFAVFIFLLFVYTPLSGGSNAFRVVTNKLYSPMTISLTDYFLIPLYLTINYTEGDFISGEKQNFLYFLLNFILSVIIGLSGCIFNEIIILFCCGLEVNTYDQVSFRSSKDYVTELYEVHSQTIDEEDIKE